MKATESKIPTEHIEQKAFVHWFRHNFPRVLIFAVPNGEKRSITVAKRLKAEGVVRGIPDLYIPEWKVFVEMKRRKGGVLSKDQKNVIGYLESIGDTVIIGRGAADASAQILAFVKEKFDKG